MLRQKVQAKGIAMHDTAVDLVRRAPAPHVAHLISSISFYRERGCGPMLHRHAAPLAFPLVVNLGTPFRIALGRTPGGADRQPSFTAGLFPGPVVIESDGHAECVQIDFTPLGAYRFYGGAVPELTARMIDIEDVLGAEGRRLRERIAGTPACENRFAIIEAFVAGRANHSPSPEVAAALSALERSAGTARMRDIAVDVGWSRKHLARRFIRETGLAPKTIGRMLRFHRACRCARAGNLQGWAAIAFETGFADQAHLTREFRSFAGETPVEWATRMQLSDPNMLREAGG